MRALLAYDGSAGADEAVGFAAALDWPSKSVLRVVSVFEPLMTPIAGSWDGGAAMAPEVDEPSMTNVMLLSERDHSIEFPTSSDPV